MCTINDNSPIALTLCILRGFSSILGESLLISCLTGKALITLVDIARLAMKNGCNVLEGSSENVNRRCSQDIPSSR